METIETSRWGWVVRSVVEGLIFVAVLCVAGPVALALVG